VKHPSEVLRKGQSVQAVVLALDPEHRRLSLGLKQLQPDVWETFFSQVRVEDILRGRVVRMAPFGAFVELQEGIEGLCHVSEMDEVHGVAVGREYLFRVIRLNPQEKRIGLSLNGVDQGELEKHQSASAQEVAPATPAQDLQPGAAAEAEAAEQQQKILAQPGMESLAPSHTTDLRESATASQPASVGETEG
jgi:small subunit ribosomal protein S1